MEVTFGSKNRGMQVGQIFGNAYFTQAAPERPETPPRPFASIPFSRDRDFVNRGDILGQLQKRCSEPAGRVALCGLGGIGKSQLAIELAYRISEQTPDSWIFWIHAATQARAEEGFRDIADTVKLPGRNKPDANIPKLVHSWLSQNRNGRWTIVLDSADDSDTLCQPRSDGNAKTLASYLPQSPNGSIVITTRNRDVGFKLTGSYMDIIEVGPMRVAEALRLLENRLGQLGNPEAAETLAQKLDCVPLAISQAAAYIQATPTSSVQKYLGDFLSDDHRRNRLLTHDAAEFRRDGAASNAILTTWQISFDHIRSHRSSAADLLSLMSFFDRQGIPLSLLKPGNSRGVQRDSDCASGTPQATSEQDDEFEADVAMLRSFCLLSMTENNTALEMHALVQLATRMWLKQSGGQKDKSHKRFIKRLAAAFPNGYARNWEAWEQCRQLFAHVKAAEYHGPPEAKAWEWEVLMRGGGCKAKHGTDHTTTLTSMAALAETLYAQGRLQKAEELQVEVLEAGKAKFGADHFITMGSMADLASTYYAQGRLEEAEQLEVKVLEASKAKLGPDNPDALTWMANLAFIFYAQGRLEEAEKLQVEVFETSKTKLGPDHHTTLTRMNSLAWTLNKQGRGEVALGLMKDCAQRRQQVLGPDHPSTVISLAAVADWSKNNEGGSGGGSCIAM
ncbi:hypothetical protein RB597_008822 [Gaeumannomyces tritici]